jgi:hypothetical protein
MGIDHRCVIKYMVGSVKVRLICGEDIHHQVPTACPRWGPWASDVTPVWRHHFGEDREFLIAITLNHRTIISTIGTRHHCNVD